MAVEGSSIERLLRGETDKKGAPSKIGALDMISGFCGGFCGGCGHSGSIREDEITYLDPHEERRLYLLSGKTFLTPRHHGAQKGPQYLKLTPPAASDVVCSSLEHAFARRSAAYPAMSSSSATSTSSSSSSVGKSHLSLPASPSMRLVVCPSSLTYVLFSKTDPRCPLFSATVPPQVGKFICVATTEGSGKKPRIDLNAAADETE